MAQYRTLFTIYRRSRPQSEQDRHEIEAVKTTEVKASARPLSPCPAVASRSVPHPSQNTPEQKKSINPASFGLQHSGADRLLAASSDSRHEQSERDPFMKKNGDQERKSPFRQVTPCRSAVAQSLNCQGSERRHSLDKPQNAQGMSEKLGEPNRRSSCASLDPPQRARLLKDPPQRAPQLKDPLQRAPPQRNPHQKDPPQRAFPQKDPPQRAPLQKDPPQTVPIEKDPPQRAPPQKDPTERAPLPKDPSQKYPPQRAEKVHSVPTSRQARKGDLVGWSGITAAPEKQLPGRDQLSVDEEELNQEDTLFQETSQSETKDGFRKRQTAKSASSREQEKEQCQVRTQNTKSQYVKKNSVQCRGERPEGREGSKRGASDQNESRGTPQRGNQTQRYQEMRHKDKVAYVRRSSVHSQVGEESEGNEDADKDTTEQQNRMQGLHDQTKVNEAVDRGTSGKEIPPRKDKSGTTAKHWKSSSDLQQDQPQRATKTPPKPTTLYIRVHDIITDMAVLGKVLTAKVNNPDFELMPTETSIKHCDKYTYCSLTCGSKRLALSLQNLILKKRTWSRPLIDCRLNDFICEEKETEQQPPDDQHQVTKRQEDHTQAKELLKKQVLFEISSMSEQALIKHKKAMDDVERKTDLSKSKLGDLYSRKETLSEIAALESKLEELEKEKAEFIKAVEGFQAKLVTVLQSDTYQEDTKLLRKQLGVECSRLERALPMYARRQDVLNLIQQNRVSILLAETGSGKSTQVVQYLLEAGFADQGMIVCTQPRKVAVVNLAARVAEELATNIGQRVGYKAGVRVKMSPSTKIVYMTDHTLLNDCLTDPDLTKFSCIVVDEAHERSLYTDLLLIMIKRCLKRRPDLKVIITSATIDPQVFISYFEACSVMKVSGRAFPVDVEWEDAANEENEFENYVDAAVDKVLEIHNKEPPGDILVFLTSSVEIQKCCEMTQQRLKDRTDFSCLPLHGQLQSEEQQKVFKPLGKNVRKIVYATNCAETSITIDGIKYVVDTGVAKDMVYDAKKKVNSLLVTAISQSSAEQRKGRAGRTAPGKCYRLYSRQSYQSMDRISLPEILKTHLSLALLKLAELGFTPDMYDFVQSPSQDSIEAALKTLHQLDALNDNLITDTGKWIVKLPCDPKLGLMTLNGHKRGLLYDAIVLASVMSTGSSLFYRGSTDKDRSKLDKVKLKFSHQGGDGLTSLEVFKAWQSVDEKQKNKWCMANSVNAKTIRGVRDSVNEIIQILKKEAKIEVQQKFSDAQETADNLQKMIFQCNMANLCHYLGKERAGYFAAQASRQVHFHPSSSMCSLAKYPEWVVYDQLLKTSRDFITGITPVDDAWLAEVDTHMYGFDVNEVSQKKLNVVFTQPAGSHAFFAIVGPRYSQLRQYEEQCSTENTENVVIVEARREVGSLRVLSTGKTKAVEDLKKRLTSIVDRAIKEVQQEIQEMTIGSENSGLRIILGQGGQQTDILMPQETRKVFITSPSEDLTPELVREKFELFGDICYIHQFPSGRNWGFVVYRTPAEAVQAVEGTKDDDSFVAQLEHRRAAKHQAQFKAKLFWCRRPCNGIGFVDISPAYMSLYLQLRDLHIGNNLVTIKMDRKKPDESLYLTGLPADISEDLIKRTLLHALHYRETKTGIIERVHIVRERVGETDKNKLKRLQEALKAKFASLLKMSSVEVSVWPPKEQTVRFGGEARFTDPIEGFAACKRLQGRLCIGTAMVDIEPIISATLHIQRQVYEVCWDDLERLKTEKLEEVDVEVEKRGHQNWLLHLKADDMESLVQARTFISEMMKGDVLDCNDAPALRHLMSPAGRKMLKEAEGKTSAYVCVDSRTQIIAIHGSAQACTKMRLKINDYLDQVLSGTVDELVLRGSNRPPGLLKTLINRYDEDLDTFREETGLLGIAINYYSHRLKLTGPPESIAKAKKIVEEVSASLTKGGRQPVDENEDSDDCVACFCPIDANDMYRLEACAHPYCRDCIKRQVGLAIKERQLPVTCCQEGCNTPLALRDFKSLSRQGHLKLPDVASSALSAYVRTNSDKTGFCSTPNCPMVYRRTSEEEAKTFQCPECNVRICTGCQAQVHEGMSCSMLRSSHKAKSGVDEWVQSDTKNRKACPGCHCPIEKIGGCNRMICDSCRTIFCWLCAKKYPTQDACYSHLKRRHGGVFDINDLLYD